MPHPKSKEDTGTNWCPICKRYHWFNSFSIWETEEEKKERAKRNQEVDNSAMLDKIIKEV